MKKRVTVILIILIFFSLLVFLASSFPLFSSFQGIIQKTFSSPKAYLYSLKNGNSNPSSELKKLQDENRALLLKLRDFKTLEADNKALRSQFELNSTTESISLSDLLPARVVGFLGPYNSPHTLIVDKGKRDGVEKGTMVIVGKSLVGLIGEVGERYSQIILPTNGSFSLIGKSLQDNTLGVIIGENDFILFERVVITDKLSSGDLVVTKGESNIIDIKVISDIVVGKITSINKQETKPFQSALLASLIDYSRLTIVFVVR